MADCPHLGFEPKRSFKRFPLRGIVARDLGGVRHAPMREARPCQGVLYSRSVSIACGFTRSAGREPALSA